MKYAKENIEVIRINIKKGEKIKLWNMQNQKEKAHKHILLS